MKVAMLVGTTNRPDRVKVLLARFDRAILVLPIRAFLIGFRELTKPVTVKKIATAARPPTQSLRKGS
jgi:hypothetical protein